MIAIHDQERGSSLLAKLKQRDPETFDPSGNLAIEIRCDESMARHTTLRLGGPADLWCRPRNAETLAKLLATCHALAMPVHFVGSGTNLLVRDGGIRGVVINLGFMNAVKRLDDEWNDADKARVHVEAGASTGRLLSAATRWQLGGVEFLAGVPGTVGGGLIMNAGTSLGEFTDVVIDVRSISVSGVHQRRVHAECGFGYRSSLLPSNEVIVGTTLQLTATTKELIVDAIHALRARRRQREPSRVSNCGSTFKNPNGHYAGQLIEQCGLKNLRRGACFVSPKHANWLVVDPQCEVPRRSRDYLDLMSMVQERVAADSGIKLQPEVRILGEDLV